MAYVELVYKVATELLGKDVFERFENDYETRLLVQKTMFVFQEAAQKDLFGYSWYLAGPYSPGVSDVVYNSIIPSIAEKRSEWERIGFSEEGKKRISRVRQFLEPVNEDAGKSELSRAGFVELIASMLYLYKYGQNKTEVVDKLIKTKGEKYGDAKIRDFVNTYWTRVQKFRS